MARAGAVAARSPAGPVPATAGRPWATRRRALGRARQSGADDGPAARWAGDMQPAAERLHAGLEAAQPGARAGVGAADAVVGDLDTS